MAPKPDPAAAPQLDEEAEYKTAWKAFDPSLQSSITTAQFRQVMAGLGEPVTDAEVDEIVNSVDGEDRISCELIPSRKRNSFDADHNKDKEFIQFVKSRSEDDIIKGYE